jgi:hypothetical protein
MTYKGDGEYPFACFELVRGKCPSAVCFATRILINSFQDA